MADQSPRMLWPFPSKEDDPWFDQFESFVRAADASGFAAREDRHLTMGDGGPLTWTPSTDTLAWGSEIFISAAMTGFRWRIAASSVTLQIGEVLYVDLNRNPLTNVLLIEKTASVVPNTDNALALAIRIGNNIYWRNGLRMTGGTIPSLSPVQITAASFSLSHSPPVRTFADAAELVVGGGLFDGSMTIPTQVAFNLIGLYVATGTAGDCRLRIYDIGTEATPAAPVLRSTLTIPFASGNATRSFSNVLSVVGTITGIDQILNTPRLYEVSAELDGADGASDIFHVYRGSLEVT